MNDDLCVLSTWDTDWTVDIKKVFYTFFLLLSFFSCLLNGSQKCTNILRWNKIIKLYLNVNKLNCTVKGMLLKLQNYTYFENIIKKIFN